MIFFPSNKLVLRKLFFFTLFTLLLGINVNIKQVYAHHSFAAEFDANSMGELTGVITEVRYRNPHVRYKINVSKEQGITEIWEIQAASVTTLRAQGWLADSLQVGEEVSVRGQLGRNGVKKLFVRGVVLADGRKFGATGSNPQTVDRNQVIASVDIDYTHGQVNSSHPFDISGPWRNSYKFRVTVDDLEPKPTPYTQEGRTLRDRTVRFDDPALRCLALGLPRIFGNPYNMDIYDVGTHYLFLYVQSNAVRRIWMDARSVPEGTVASSNGYSVGHWEGDELVIETTHLLSGWLDGSGLPMTGETTMAGEGTRTVERYKYSSNRLSVDRVMTIYDPYYTEPLVRVRGSARGSMLDVSEQDSCDPASYYLDLLDAKVLEEYLLP